MTEQSSSQGCFSRTIYLSDFVIIRKENWKNCKVMRGYERADQNNQVLTFIREKKKDKKTLLLI